MSVVRVKVRKATEVKALLLKSAEADRLSTTIYTRLKESQKKDFLVLSKALQVKPAELSRLLCLSALRVPRKTLMEFLRE